MQVFCTRCSRELEVPNTALHKRVKCTLCGEVFQAELPKAVLVDDDDAGDVEILGPADPPPPPAAAPFSSRPVAPRPSGTPRGNEPFILPPPIELRRQAPPPEEEDDILEPDLVEEEPAPEPADPFPTRPRIKRSDALAQLAEGGKFVPRAKRPPGWFFHDADGTKHGPLQGKGIVQAIKEGKVTRDTILINSRTDKQLRAGDVPGLFKEKSRAGTVSPLSPLAAGKAPPVTPAPNAKPARPAEAEPDQPADDALDALSRAAGKRRKQP